MGRVQLTGEMNRDEQEVRGTQKLEISRKHTF